MVDIRESSGRPSTPDLELAFSQPTPNDIVGFRQRYRSTVDARQRYWHAAAARLSWETPIDSVCEEDFQSGRVAWFQGARLDLVASLESAWSREAAERPVLTVRAAEGETAFPAPRLFADAARLASALRRRGLAPGDRVALWLPDGRPLFTLMLAIARAGLVAVPLPRSFPLALVRDCVADAGARLVLHAGGDLGGPEEIVIPEGPLGESALEALAAQGHPQEAPRAGLPSEAPLALLYARATGRPRGSVFAAGGFLVQAATTAPLLWAGLGLSSPPELVLDAAVGLCSEEGLSLGLWGALLTGQPVVLGPGAGPDATPGRGLWLTSPGRIREQAAALAEGSAPTLAIVASSGEPLSPRLVRAAARFVAGPERVLNLWSQTEAGGSLLFTRPVPALNRPGSLGLPLFGTTPQVVNDFGEPCAANESGRLVFLGSWPGMVRGIWGQPERYVESYLARLPGAFTTQDAVRVDTDGFYWFMGRLDDVVKVDGASLATSEVEMVLTSHDSVHEAAVVGVTAESGLRLVAFVVPSSDAPVDTVALQDLVEARMGRAARPTHVVVARELPRTHTGKVVRRLLKRVASADADARDDLGHVANPECLDDLAREIGRDEEGGRE